jgi:hypothetical protein
LTVQGDYMGILANHRGAILAFSIGAPLVGFGLTLVYFGGDPYGSLRPLLVQFGLLADVLFVGGAVTFAFYRRAEAKRKAEWALLLPVCAGGFLVGMSVHQNLWWYLLWLVRDPFLYGSSGSLLSLPTYMALSMLGAISAAGFWLKWMRGRDGMSIGGPLIVLRAVAVVGALVIVSTVGNILSRPLVQNVVGHLADSATQEPLVWGLVMTLHLLSIILGWMVSVLLLWRGMPGEVRGIGASVASMWLSMFLCGEPILGGTTSGSVVERIWQTLAIGTFAALVTLVYIRLLVASLRGVPVHGN